jgi:hypothetical protein
MDRGPFVNQKSRVAGVPIPDGQGHQRCDSLLFRLRGPLFLPKEPVEEVVLVGSIGLYCAMRNDYLA